MPAPEEKPKLPDRWPLAVRLGLSVWPEFVVTEWGSLGISAEVGMRYRFFSFGAELHGNPPIGSRSFSDAGKVSFARLSGALLLCGHYGWFAGCVVGDVGRFFFPNSRKLPPSTHYGAIGVRLGLEFPVAPPRFFLRAALDFRAPIRPQSFTDGDTTLFKPAGPGVGISFAFFAELDP